MQVPPSYKSATSPANFHSVVIAYSSDSSDQLGLRPPYDKILFWRCYKCPALNGTISMDRHLAALLQALSFKSMYKSTAKPANLLNTVAETNRQTTQALPPTQQSANIPQNIRRRGRNRRENRHGVHPVYNLFAPTRASFGSRDSPTAPLPSGLPGPGATPPGRSGSIPSPSSPQVAASPPSPPSTPSPPSQAGPSSPTVVESEMTNDENNGSQDFNNNNDNWVPQQRSPQPSTSRPRNSGRANQSPENLLDRYLGDLDPNNIYRIPGASQVTGGDFTVDHLQEFGLQNDANICSLISVFLCFVRIDLKEHLIDPHLCFTPSRVPDFPSWVIMKILTAMPSQDSFSLHLFVESWNAAKKSPRIDPGFADVPSLIEGLIGNLQVKQYANKPPVFTKYFGSFICNKCGKEYKRVQIWQEQVQASLPILVLPAGNQTANIVELLEEHIQEPFQTRCENVACRNRISNGKLEVELGHFTVISLNRFVGGGSKLLNKLEISRTNEAMINLGDLVSVVCHRGDVNWGHFVSYHKVNDQWYLNDDSRQISPQEDPLAQSVENETVDLLFFKTVLE